MKSYLLFDLDGTLTDPKEGITKSVAYALQSFGINEPDLNQLTPFIGPPLLNSFKEFYGLDEKQAQLAVEKYRERFATTGIFENKVYRGIGGMLKELKKNGMHLMIASSKPEHYVRQILEHYKLAQYFEVIVGSNMDHTRTDKKDVVQEVLRRCALKYGTPPKAEKMYLIGDRKFDVIGAKSFGIESVGVTYGYGSIEELQEANADFIVQSVGELRDFLLRGTKDPIIPSTLFAKIWAIAFPMLLFLAVRRVSQMIVSILIMTIGLYTSEEIGQLLFIHQEGAAVGFSDTAGIMITTISYLCAALVVSKRAIALLQWARKDLSLLHLRIAPFKEYVLLGIMTLASIFGVNMLLTLLQLTSESALYPISTFPPSPVLTILGVLCYGLITPLAEELLFRGILLQKLRLVTTQNRAILISAFLFGFYHLNVTQAIYGFVIGMIMAYAYLNFGKFWIPLAIHMLSNLLAFFFNFFGLSGTILLNWPLCVGFLCILIGTAFLLIKAQSAQPMGYKRLS